jgi:uncharacterized membrane protein YphA (DoxX/SURF4 family)
MSKYEKMREFAPLVLRVGIALVFLWFGTDQLMNPENWSGTIPQSVVDMSGMSAETIVYLNGGFEVIFCLALLVGLFTRIAALLLALHLMSILFVVGYNHIGVRDFGLMMATLSIFLHGPDSYSLDSYIARKKA